MSDLWRLTAHEAHEKLRAKEITSVELTQSGLQPRIGVLLYDPALFGICAMTFHGAFVADAGLRPIPEHACSLIAVGPV